MKSTRLPPRRKLPQLAVVDLEALRRDAKAVGAERAIGLAAIVFDCRYEKAQPLRRPIFRNAMAAGQKPVIDA